MVDIATLHPLLDGDVFQYALGFSADSQIKKDVQEAYPDLIGQELENYLAEYNYEQFAISTMRKGIEKVVEKFRGDYTLFLTGSGNYREQVATILPYKGNRDVSHKPKYYSSTKQFLLDDMGAVLVNGREADDSLGCAQWAAKDRSTCIVTIDKDLDQIPGHHFNWRKDEFYNVTMAEANTKFWKQMLEGDRVDNIPGIAGIGPKRAAALLDDQPLETQRELVKQQYAKQYGEGWIAPYREVATLLWIQRIEGEECPFLD